MNEDLVAEKIIAMEKAALEKWSDGNPSGFIEICADDVVYFDPFNEKRLDGLDELKGLYESIRGNFKIDWWEMPNPKVAVGTDMAVLTFNFNSRENGIENRWNCTEVYRKEKDAQWKIIQTHWSFTKPELKS